MLFFFNILLSLFVFSGEVRVVDPCSQNLLFREPIGEIQGLDVGTLSVNVFDAYGVPYIGNNMGIHSIYETPTGEDALEILSKSEMRAYGWCYSVDGIEPEVLPNQYLIPDDESVVVWFFGFAHYQAGEWVSQCERLTPAKNQVYLEKMGCEI
ncbi:MAG: hypothetical protein AAF203_11345 [Pseudomonadota bacterium]